jgi:peptidoglycan/LPS O-acetylase OafA/YrhL
VKQEGVESIMKGVVKLGQKGHLETDSFQEPCRQNLNARRHDIDLLRALAVLSVILFHFDVKELKGGFLGVDIFFVISGYLITLHIRQQLNERSFSFVNFYARRIRRLFPALAATLLLTSICALFVLPAALQQEFSRSAIASSVYASNLYFWTIADYFDTESIYKPLLHIWSLSVEEQFYIFWPLFLVVFFRRKLNVFITVLGIASLFAGLFINFQPTTVFYHFPFRVHEFAIGALIGGLSLSRLPRWVCTMLMLTALIAIFYGLLTTTEHSAFPGWGSGAVIVGTALLIAVSHPLLNANYLIYRPILRIGLTSYSAYLVHWPLVVFYKIMFPGKLNIFEVLMLLGMTLLMAEIFYRCIEQPPLRVKLPHYRLAVIAMAPAIFVYTAAYNQYYPSVLELVTAEKTTNVNRLSVKKMLDNMQDRRLVIEESERVIKANATGRLVPDRKIIVVLGDSHGDDLSRALRLVLGDDNVNVVLLHSICDPLTFNSISIPLGKLYESHPQEATKKENYCLGYHVDFLDKLKQVTPDLIVFSAAWRADALPYLRKTIEDIGAVVPAKILLLGRVPQFVGSPDVIFQNAVDVDQMNQMAWLHRYQIFDDFDSILSGIARDTGVYFISKTDIVCPNKVCDIGIESEIGYTDAQHWSIAGMRLYGRRVIADPIFRRALSESSRPMVK